MGASIATRSDTEAGAGTAARSDTEAGERAGAALRSDTEAGAGTPTRSDTEAGAGTAARSETEATATRSDTEAGVRTGIATRSNTEVGARTGIATRSNTEAGARSTKGTRAQTGTPAGTGEREPERPSIPFLRPDRPVTGAHVTVEIQGAIGTIIAIARGQLPPRSDLVAQILGALETVATDSAGNFSVAVLSAREIFNARNTDNVGVSPLFDALDRARILTAASVHQLYAPESIRLRALRALSTAHQRLVSATTGLVLEAVAPISDRLRDVQIATVELRDAVAKAEVQRADLEHQFATLVDASLPWGARGTEW